MNWSVAAKIGNFSLNAALFCRYREIVAFYCYESS